MYIFHTYTERELPHVAFWWLSHKEITSSKMIAKNKKFRVGFVNMADALEILYVFLETSFVIIKTRRIRVYADSWTRLTLKLCSFLHSKWSAYCLVDIQLFCVLFSPKILFQIIHTFLILISYWRYYFLELNNLLVRPLWNTPICIWDSNIILEFNNFSIESATKWKSPSSSCISFFEFWK